MSLKSDRQSGTYSGFFRAALYVMSRCSCVRVTPTSQGSTGPSTGGGGGGGGEEGEEQQQR